MGGAPIECAQEGEACVVPAPLPQHICLCVCSISNSRRFSHLPSWPLEHGHLIDGARRCRFGPDTDTARRLSKAITSSDSAYVADKQLEKEHGTTDCDRGRAPRRCSVDV